MSTKIFVLLLLANLHNFKFLFTKFKYQVEPFSSAELHCARMHKEIISYGKAAQILADTCMLITWHIFSEAVSPSVKTVVRHRFLPAIINSALNPVIYTVRKRQFRIAFIELLLNKSLQEAEEFGMTLFGS